MHEQALSQSLMLGVELPSQEAEQAPLPQCTVVPEQDDQLEPNSMEQDASPQWRSKSAQPLRTSQTREHA